MPQDSKIKAVVKETEVPKSAKEVKSFEGLVHLLLKVYSEYRTGSGTLLGRIRNYHGKI